MPLSPINEPLTTPAPPRSSATHTSSTSVAQAATVDCVPPRQDPPATTITTGTATTMPPVENPSAVWRRIARRVALGQLASMAMALTGVFTTLLVNDNASAPFLQNLCAYIAIGLIALPIHVAWGRPPKAAMSEDVDAADISRGERRWTPSRADFLPRHFPLWRYAVIAAFDFGGNALTVWAYNYTSLISVQLLDCFAILVVVVLSYVVFRRVPNWAQWIGCGLAVAGLAVLVYLDTVGDSQSTTGTSPLLGDMLCLAGSASYAFSNVACEALVKANHHPADAVAIDAHPHAGVAALYAAVDSDSESGRSPAVAIDAPTAAAATTTVTVATALATEAAEARPALPFFIGGGPRQQLGARPPSPWALLVEYVAFLAPCGAVYASVAVAISHASTASATANATGVDWAYLFGFSCVMVVVYFMMPALFIVSSATFANISLLSSDVYALIMNFVVFGVKPHPAFFAPFVVIIAGVIAYQGPIDFDALLCNHHRERGLSTASQRRDRSATVAAVEAA